jgi:hypothetical protein
VHKSAVVDARVRDEAAELGSCYSVDTEAVREAAASIDSPAVVVQEARGYKAKNSDQEEHRSRRVNDSTPMS